MNIDEEIIKIESEIAALRQVAFQIKVKEAQVKKLKRLQEQAKELLNGTTVKAQ